MASSIVCAAVYWAANSLCLGLGCRQLCMVCASCSLPPSCEACGPALSVYASVVLCRSRSFCWLWLQGVIIRPPPLDTQPAGRPV